MRSCMATAATRFAITRSLEELRAGVHARNPNSNGATSQTLTLEEIFLNIVGSEPSNRSSATHPEQELSWLG